MEAIAAVGSLHQHQLATAASFAHELKNPLAAMQGLATLVRRRGTREPELAAELDAIVADEVAAAGEGVSLRQMGQVIKAVNARAKGRADGATVAAKVKAALAP